MKWALFEMIFWNASNDKITSDMIKEWQNLNNIHSSPLVLTFGPWSQLSWVWLDMMVFLHNPVFLSVQHKGRSGFLFTSLHFILLSQLSQTPPAHFVIVRIFNNSELTKSHLLLSSTVSPPTLPIYTKLINVVVFSYMSPGCCHLIIGVSAPGFNKDFQTTGSSARLTSQENVIYQVNICSYGVK